MSATAPTRPRNRPLRLTYAAVALNVLLLVGAPLAVRWYAVWSAERHLASAIAEADQLDPGWRLEELIAKQEVVPEGENSAPFIRHAYSLMPKDWMAPRDLPNQDKLFIDMEIYYLRLGHLLPQDLLKIVLEEMAKVEDALAAAQRINNLPRGHFGWPLKTLVSGKSDDFQAARLVGDLLAYDALVRLQEANNNLASLRSLGALNAGRSMGDSPSAITWMVRLSRTEHSIRSIERVLSLSVPDPELLVRIQKELEAERRVPATVPILRACRAAMFEVMRGEGAMKWLEFIEGLNRSFSSTKPGVKEEEEKRQFRAKWRHVLCPDKAMIDENLASYLESASQAVELAKTPAAGRTRPWKEMTTERDRLDENEGHQNRFSLLIRGVGSADEKLVLAVLKCHAALDCAILGLAAERFRLAKGRWPDTLQELVPAYVPAVPEDPYSEGKLLIRRRPEGIVIYSFGYNEVDDGGLLDCEGDDKGLSNKDYGFRVLNPSRRRMLPLPLKEDPPSPPPPPEETP